MPPLFLAAYKTASWTKGKTGSSSSAAAAPTAAVTARSEEQEEEEKDPGSPAVPPHKRSSWFSSLMRPAAKPSPPTQTLDNDDADAEAEAADEDYVAAAEDGGSDHEEGDIDDTTGAPLSASSISQHNALQAAKKGTPASRAEQ